MKQAATISRGVKLAVLLTMLSLFAASVPIVHADDYYRGGADRYAFDNGYRDGLRHGRFDRNEHHRYNIHSQQYNDASQGYDRSMGPFKYYKQAYRGGYARGYEEGYNSFRGEGWR
jgi:hypothetical protein